MAVIRCEHGHYYDNEKYISCPHCENGQMGHEERQMGDSVTIALDNQMTEEYAAQYVRSQTAGQHIELDSEKTIGIYATRDEAKYIVGWLVCIDGPAKGTDYRLLTGFNRIGRGHSNDIVLTTDMQVSRELHCSIIYEEKKNKFYVMPQAGCLTYLREEIVDQAVEINSGDVIRVGESYLELVAFCQGDKKWKKNC